MQSRDSCFFALVTHTKLEQIIGKIKCKGTSDHYGFYKTHNAAKSNCSTRDGFMGLDVFPNKYSNFYRSTFLQEKILTAASVYILTSVMYIPKYKYQFSKNSQTYNYATCSKNKIKTIIGYKQRRERSPFGGTKPFSHLPESMICLEHKNFTNKLKRHLLACVFYTIEEFLKYAIN